MDIWDTIRGVGISLLLICGLVVTTYSLMNRASK